MGEQNNNPAADAPNPLLNILKDIELPEPVSWWPPAPGWWILAAILLATVFWIVRALIMRHRRGAYRREAMASLESTLATFRQDADGATYVESVTSLLRRIAIHISGRESVARLTGERWIAKLNSLTTNPLSGDCAQTLETALYQKRSDVRVDDIHPQLVDFVSGLVAPGKDQADA